MDEVRILDAYKSFLSEDDIEKFSKEITKIKNSPVCPNLTTMEVIEIGLEAMKKDGFCFVEEQLDV